VESLGKNAQERTFISGSEPFPRERREGISPLVSTKLRAGFCRRRKMLWGKEGELTKVVMGKDYLPSKRDLRTEEGKGSCRWRRELV